jgi:hypothetical protein
MLAPNDTELAAPRPESQPQPWKFWGTTLWAVAMMATFTVVGVVWLFALATRIDLDPDTTREDFRALVHSHLALEIAGFVVAGICGFAVMGLAIRLSGIGIRDYLGLVAPRAHDIGLGFLGLIAIYLAFWLLFYLLGDPQSRFVVNLYREAHSGSYVPFLLLGTVVVAPFCEEVLFRGFLYGGWAVSRLRPLGAVVLTSAAWTAMHTQYDWPILAQIFCMGFLYGAIRRRGGATTTTMILHAGQNAWSFAYFELLDRFGLIAAS